MLKKLIQNTWHKFTGKALIFGETFSAALLNSIAESGGQILEDAAYAAVRSVANSKASGTAKFTAATTAVISVLTTEGIPFATTAVQGAVLAAYAQLKLEQ